MPVVTTVMGPLPATAEADRNPPKWEQPRATETLPDQTARVTQTGAGVGEEAGKLRDKHFPKPGQCIVPAVVDTYTHTCTTVASA